MASRIGDDLKARALWFTAPRTAALRAETVGPPGPEEVRVETIASAVSAGTEMLVYRDEVPHDLPLDLPTLAGSYAFPIKYGYAAAGRVLDTGPGVENLSPGDPVFVHHPHQEVFVVPAQITVRLRGPRPRSWCVRRQPRDGPERSPRYARAARGDGPDLGQGVVGFLVALLLKLSGAGPILVVDPLEERRNLALATGADGVFAPGGLNERVMEFTGGRGADVAVETSGSGAACRARSTPWRPRGRSSWLRGTASSPSRSRSVVISTGEGEACSSQVGSNPTLAPRWDRARRMETAFAGPAEIEGAHLPPYPIRRGA